MRENWKPVNIGEGYEGQYIVSSLGRVKGLRSGRYLKGRSNQRGKGYYKVALYKNNKPKDFYIHRIVAFAFLPMIVGKDEVNHIDGDPSNNILENLEWCSRQENMTHALESGLYQNKFKLLENKELIQKLMLEGYSYNKIGEMFGCHPGHINYFALKESLQLPYKHRKVFTEEHLVECLRLLKLGFKVVEVVEKLGFHRRTIVNNLNKAYGKEYVDYIRFKNHN